MPVYKLGNVSPRVAPSAYVAPGATVIGNVTLAADSSVWFGAVLRGDNEHIHIGEGVNVQDGAVLHTDPGFAMNIGANINQNCHCHGAKPVSKLIHRPREQYPTAASRSTPSRRR